MIPSGRCGLAWRSSKGLAQSPTARVLLLATARPEFTPPWPARSNLTTVQLARLAKRQAREMVERLVDAEILFARGEPPAGTRWKQSRVQSRELRVRRQRKGASTTPSI